MKNQAYYIQRLLVNKLDNCKGKENKYADRHIKKIQDVYKQDNLEMKKLMVDNKEKQQIQDEEFFLYKPYNVDPPRPKITEPICIQDEINNLEKYIKYM